MKKLQAIFSAFSIKRSLMSDAFCKSKMHMEYRNSNTMKKNRGCWVGRRLAFLFSLEAAFSLTLVIVAAACLLAFAPQKESAGQFLACSDAAGALLELRAFSSQEKLQAAVSEAGALLHICVEAESAGLSASSCEAGGGSAGEKYSFSFPVWKDGRVENARVGCYQMD